ncbi:disease resistance protein Pik-2-like [Aegilops tauschii subsp. strangulata]|nr:disease resistance protein Pik-2-like [Aegilops tauschii subsp. strangulata]
MEPGCSVENLLKEVHRLAKLKLTAHEQADARSDENGGKLYHVLNGRSFLLILGGITSKTILNSMRASLPVNGCQVMLLLDTENEDIAWHADSINGVGSYGVYMLTRHLFFWRVLRKQAEESNDDKDDEDEDDEDEEQAEKRYYGGLVHEITGGYPMAIVLLAGLLRFKEKPLQWNAVLQQLMYGNNGTHQVQRGAVLQQLRSENNGTQDASECLPNTQITNLSGDTRRAMEVVFWASFEDLHNDLRSCYLYFASYPTNSSHPADQLVRMWIGEGFIKARRGKTMEEVGHDYLKELVLRCLVEVEEMKANGGIQLVRVHKSLMGFLESEARETGFMEMHDIHDVVVPPSVRRLSVQSDNGKRYNITFASKKFPKLRSFICRINIIDDDIRKKEKTSSMMSIRINSSMISSSSSHLGSFG